MKTVLTEYICFRQWNWYFALKQFLLTSYCRYCVTSYSDVWYTRDVYHSGF